MNYIQIFFKGIGFADSHNEPYEFVTAPPRRIGDEAIILVKQGRKLRSHHVILLRSYGHIENATYLVAR